MTSGKLGRTVNLKKGDPNSPKRAVIIEHDISGHTFLLLPREDGPNYIINCTFLLITQ